MFGIEMYIHEAFYIGWLTVGTVTPAGHPKLLLDYVAKSKDFNSSHTTKNADDQESRGDNLVYITRY